MTYYNGFAGAAGWQRLLRIMHMRHTPRFQPLHSKSLGPKRLFLGSPFLRLGRYIRAALLGSCLLALGGCTQISLAVVNTLAWFGNYTRVTDIAYGPDPLNRLDIYTPEAASAPRPTVVFFYGGCWGGCDTVTKGYYRFVGEALTASGFTAVLADYRRHPQVKFRQIMDDAAAATAWVAANVDDYGGDPDRIYLMGHSAGAHLAAMLALDENYLAPAVRKQVRGAIGLAGPYDFLPLNEAYQQTLFGPPANYPASQPINFVDGGEPPMLLLHGLDDTMVKQKNLVNLAAKINRLHGSVETRLYPDIDHAGILAALSKPLRDSHPVLNDIANFIRSSGAANDQHSAGAGALTQSEFGDDL
ncbi:alpha/beta hydrolase [Exilibacterium tricleocarpae]|uniref:Alpha/beta hydrolase n=1 Tax=Exilibacterium tricleocarpae TaxID=2591008 RepID=A0A545TZN6_9GAMM|nr:alpha/beta hydrolase [Exilibacterium tricleocarpae]TQV82680.1 alpha/beta hydrolase [Exilibacterium tricleocarpae]